jgi:hypothetical protein
MSHEPTEQDNGGGKGRYINTHTASGERRYINARVYESIRTLPISLCLESRVVWWVVGADDDDFCDNKGGMGGATRAVCAGREGGTATAHRFRSLPRGPTARAGRHHQVGAGARPRAGPPPASPEKSLAAHHLLMAQDTDRSVDSTLLM